MCHWKAANAVSKSRVSGSQLAVAAMEADEDATESGLSGPGEAVLPGEGIGSPLWFCLSPSRIVSNSRTLALVSASSLRPR